MLISDRENGEEKTEFSAFNEAAGIFFFSLFSELLLKLMETFCFL